MNFAVFDPVAVNSVYKLQFLPRDAAMLARSWKS